MSARKVAQWRALAEREGKAFPPAGESLAPGWVWVCAQPGRPAHFALHETAALSLDRKSWGWGVRVGSKALRVAGGAYYTDGRTGAPAVFATALEASQVASAYAQGVGQLGRMRNEPDYVQLEDAPGLRWERCTEDAGEGKVWLRPAFVALRVNADRVKPWTTT